MTTREFTIEAKPQEKMYLTMQLAEVERGDVKAEVVATMSGTKLLLWVKFPDGTRVREELDWAPLIEPWIMAIEEEHAGESAD